jgi:glycosyltransferase involved in cell wall biosynthesis
MNILFYTKYFSLGGVETVTVFLANRFSSEGHMVHIISSEEPGIVLKRRIKNSIKVSVLPKKYSFSVSMIRKIIQDDKIEIIINQWGHIIFNCFLLKIAIRKITVKLISVYHNQPCSRRRSFIIDRFYAWNMKYVYCNSERYVLLSRRFIKPFCDYIHTNDVSKIAIIPNPVTVFKSEKSGRKEKLIIYVGRIDKNQKHVERIVALWENINSKLPGWSLRILGDGSEKKILETYCNKMEIDRIYFEGICDPDPYYDKASILLLTSDFEGFPLVLPEAMSYGVVPVVYHGFLALEDIVVNNQNGVIVEPSKDMKFSMDNFKKKLMELVIDEQRLRQLSQNAIESSKYFSSDNIYRKWEKLFESVTRV